MIGVFDSGIGGLTVVRKMQGEDVIYFADTAHLPYGKKKKEEIIGYARKIIAFLISQGAEKIIIACNTATAASLEAMKAEYDLPIIGVIEAGAKGAAAGTKNKKIGIIATEGTVKSGAYDREIKKLIPDAEVFGQGCPDFVTLAEAGKWSGPELEEKAKEYLAPLNAAGVDTIVLGCTHFPLLAETISKFTDAKLIDPADHIFDKGENAGNKKGTGRFYASALDDSNRITYCEVLRKILSSQEPLEWTVRECS